VDHCTDSQDGNASESSPKCSRDKKASPSPHRQDNEYDLYSFEEHSFERCDAEQPILAPSSDSDLLFQRMSLALKRKILVVDSHNTSGPEDGLSKPPHPKQKEQHPDRELKQPDRQKRKHRAKQEDQERQDNERSGRTSHCRSPTSNSGDGQDDAERFHDLDKGRKEGG
jgi:hypothetical protein